MLQHLLFLSLFQGSLLLVLLCHVSELLVSLLAELLGAAQLQQQRRQRLVHGRACAAHGEQPHVAQRRGQIQGRDTAFEMLILSDLNK